MYKTLICVLLSAVVFGVEVTTKLVLKLVLCGAIGFIGIIVGSVFDKPFPESNWRHDVPSTLGAIAGALGAAWIIFV